MSGLFDHLKEELKKRQQKQGIRPTDLLTLPAGQRRVMRLLLRETQMTYPDLQTAVAALPEKQRIPLDELDDILATLTAEGWVIRMGQDELITYRVDLRRKPGSNLSDNIWGNLQKRLEERPSKHK